MQSKRFDNQTGSAVVEFVLVLAPMLVVFNVILSAVFGSMLRATSVALASEIAETCGFADFEPQNISTVAESRLPRWVQLKSATCSRQSPLVTITLKLAMKYPFQNLESEVTWHGASELG